MVGSGVFTAKIWKSISVPGETVVQNGVPLAARTIGIGGLHITEALSKDHGVIGYEPELMAPHYERVESFMGVRPVDPRVQGRRNEEELYRLGLKLHLELL